MSNSSGTTIKTGGIGFGGMLAILFIGLKLTGHIDWSWLWVLSPLWIPVAIIISILLAIGLGASLVVAFTKAKRALRSGK